MSEMSYNPDMYSRSIQLPDNNSFFLFGPRGTGKSTLLRDQFKKTADTAILWLDLLDPELEERYSQQPHLLKEELIAQKVHPTWVIIDEIQKVPELLDVAHWAIENLKINFALTGSSARKLKRGASNLLAGRAFDRRLHPLTMMELGKRFNLNEVLSYGSLPKIFQYKEDEDKKDFLTAYTRTYLREEIQVEQLTRKIKSFRNFLGFAGSLNGKIIKFSKIAQQSGIDEKSVARFYDILEDTLLGFNLEPLERSIRKRQRLSPKFYLFDLGVTRALSHQFDLNIQEGTSAYGELFESFFVLECIRYRDYLKSEDQFSYLNTKDNLEIDLIIEGSKRKYLIEIKSKNKVIEEDLRHLRKVKTDFQSFHRIVACREKVARETEDGIRILPYDQALKEIFFPQKELRK